MSRHWFWVRIAQIGVDALLLLASFLLAYFLKVGWIFSTDFPFAPYFAMSCFSVLLWIGILLLAKYYRLPPRSGKRMWFDVVLSFLAGGVAVALFLVIFLFNREETFSRALTLMALAFGFFALFLSREIVYFLFRAFKKQEVKLYKTLIVGANRITEKLIKDIHDNPFAPYIVMGVIDPYGLARSVKGSNVLGKLDKLEILCQANDITAIIQCDAFEHTMNLISFAHEKNIKFQFAPALRGVVDDHLRIREVAGNTLISFVYREQNGVKKWGEQLKDFVLRQVFDVD